MLINGLQKVQFAYIIRELAHKVGTTERSEESDMRKALRLLALKWNCKLDNLSCKTAASTRLLSHTYSKARYISFIIIIVVIIHLYIYFFISYIFSILLY